ncbi:MAG: 4-diphosphocytidyl-2-C-methyl-D-erythritol kinase, partial [Alphaproteobacteria bacterium MarineAlpha4_Bin2]
MSETIDNTVTIEAAAKINLYLHVVGRRANGYHELDSLIAFTDVSDTLTLEPSNELSLEIEGTFAPHLPRSEDNLVLRAARALGKEAGVKPRARITLRKELPIAAGLGSGSADAAAALRGLAKLWNTDTKVKDLKKVGFSLGADIPACIFSNTVHVGGVGEHLQPGPNLPDAGLLLVNPGVTLATPSVFQARRGGFSPKMPLITS